jgi:hypothetical protein
MLELKIVYALAAQKSATRTEVKLVVFEETCRLRELMNVLQTIAVAFGARRFEARR